MVVDNRPKLVEIAKELIHHHNECFWTESSVRWRWKNYTVPTFPLTTDCSGSVTAINYWAKNTDPSGRFFTGGDTATILQHAQANHLVLPHIDKVLHGDLIMFGSGWKPVHVVMALEDGAMTEGNPDCFSLGRPHDPMEYKLSELTILGPMTFIRTLTEK